MPLPLTSGFVTPLPRLERYAAGSAEDMALGAAIERAHLEEYRIRQEAQHRYGNPTQFIYSDREQATFAMHLSSPSLTVGNSTTPLTVDALLTFRTVDSWGVQTAPSTYQHENPAWITQQNYITTELNSNTCLRAAQIQWDAAAQWATTADQITAFNQVVRNLVGPAEDAPRKKAKRLLYSHLTDYQKRMYRKKRYFHVVSEKGRKYRICHGDTQNIYLLENGKPAKRFCAHPHNVPVEDAMLAQKLMLETDEQRFLRVANESPVPYGMAA